MCEQRDAMREVRAAAECLSSVCKARRDPTIQKLVALYEATANEPVPPRLQRTLDDLEDGRPGSYPH